MRSKKTTKAGAKILGGARQARAYARGEKVEGLVVREPVDVAAVREKTGLSQVAFAATFDLDVSAVRDWEQKRRVPERGTQNFLRVIEAEPAFVKKVLERA